MKKRLGVYALLAIVALLLAGPARAADPANQDWQATFTATLNEKGLEQAITESLNAGAPAQLITQLAIEAGGNPYQVVKTALEAGADLQGVVAGATAAGVSGAVISKAAIDAGSNPARVAAALGGETGLGYTPATGDTPLPVVAGLPGGGGGSPGFISPSSP